MPKISDAAEKTKALKAIQLAKGLKSAGSGSGRQTTKRTTRGLSFTFFSVCFIPRQRGPDVTERIHADGGLFNYVPFFH